MQVAKKARSKQRPMSVEAIGIEKEGLVEVGKLRMLALKLRERQDSRVIFGCNPRGLVCEFA